MNLACLCIPRRAAAFLGFQARDQSAQVKRELILTTDSLAPSFRPWNQPSQIPLPNHDKTPEKWNLHTAFRGSSRGLGMLSRLRVSLSFFSPSLSLSRFLLFLFFYIHLPSLSWGRVGGDKLEALALGPRPQDRAPPARGRSKGRNTPHCAASPPGGAAPGGLSPPVSQSGDGPPLSMVLRRAQLRPSLSEGQHPTSRNPAFSGSATASSFPALSLSSSFCSPPLPVLPSRTPGDRRSSLTPL